MKKYIVRAVKYLIYVAVIFVIVYFSMDALGYTTIKPAQLSDIAASNEAIMMLVVLFLLICLHPLISYTNRDFNLDFHKNRETIVNMFMAYGYAIDYEDEKCVKFRASNKFVRLTAMYEDTITIDLTTFPSKIQGKRKMVARVCYRLNC